MKRLFIIATLAAIGCTPMVIKHFSISYTPRAVLVSDYASTSSNVQGIIYSAGQRLDSYDSLGISQCKITFTDTNFIKTGYRTISDDHGYFKVDFMPAGTYHVIFQNIDGRDKVLKNIKVYKDSIIFLKLNINEKDFQLIKNTDYWD